jgi:Predicted aminoglycoside phosphotransferase
MRSKTKTALSRDDIALLVADNFGRDVLPLRVDELKGGMCNSAYRIELGGERGPRSVVLKVSMSPSAKLLSHEGDNMVAELEAYSRVAAETTVPVPRIIRQDLSMSRIDARYFFMDCLDGRPLLAVGRSMGAADKARLKRDLAGCAAQIHSIKGEYFGYITTRPERRHRSWRDAYASMVGMIIDDSTRIGIPLPYERILNTVERNIALLDAVTEPRLVHNDFWGGNVFIECDDRSQRLQAIVDFERGCWGDPLAEFTANYMIVGDAWADDVFWPAYAEASGLPSRLSDSQLRRIQLYRAYLYMVMIVETYRYGKAYAALQRSFSLAALRKALRKLDSA